MDSRQPEYHGHLPTSKRHDSHSKERIGAAHSLTLHLKHYKPGLRAGAKALIAESNPDMQYLYRRYLDRTGFDVTIVGSGRVP